MSYRDDREALLHRTEALERELKAAKVETERHRIEAERLREELAESEAEDEPEPEPPKPKSVETDKALVAPPPPRPFEHDSARLAVGAVGVGWSIAALVAGIAPWMVPVAIATTVGAGWVAKRSRRWRVGRALRARWPMLPIDSAAYRDLVTLERRSVVVRVDVSFERALPRGERERANKKLRGVGAIGRDGETLTITSNRLRTSRKQRGTNAYEFDPEPIVRFCDAVFAKLLTLDHVPTITAVRAYPRAR